MCPSFFYVEGGKLYVGDTPEMLQFLTIFRIFIFTIFEIWVPFFIKVREYALHFFLVEGGKRHVDDTPKMLQDMFHRYC